MTGMPPTDSVRRLVISAVMYARARLQILEVQASEERQRLIAMLKASLVTAVGLLISLQLVATLVVVLSWDTAWRVHVIGGLVVLALALTALAWKRLQTLASRPAPRPISEILEDLDRFVEQENQQ